MRSLLAVVAVFTLSRIGYHIAGVRFDTSSLPWFWQFVDPALLKVNLGQSLWYLHSQPPAFNFFLGVVLSLFPGHEAAVFAACYLLLGLAFAVALFLLLRGFGVSDVLSAAASALYIASPTVVLYENWLFYAYPVTVLLLLAALFWQRFVRRGRYLDAFLLFTCAAMLALTWSLFHLIWLLGLVLALLRRKDWRKVLAAAAIPLLIVTLWYGKNLAQVGEFTGSTWVGMNFSRITNSKLTKPERKALYDGGAISPVSFIQPFRLLEYYDVAPGQPTGIPVLDQAVKPSGSPNFNNRLYVDISRQYGRDALKVLRLRPVAYLRGLAEAYSLYFQPACAYSYLTANTARLGTIVSINAGGFVALAYGLIIFVVPVLLLRHPLFCTHRLPMLFLWFNVAWVTIVANAVEVGENNRFRFAADPLVFATLVAVSAALVRSLPPRHKN
jgi:hypothetical protein